MRIVSDNGNVIEGNPSAFSLTEIERKKRSKPVNVKETVNFDGTTGEVTKHTIEDLIYEPVDSEAFIKLYLSARRELPKVSNGGLLVLGLVFDQVWEKPNTDIVTLYHKAYNIPTSSFYRGLNELIKLHWLYKHPVLPNTFYINLKWFFNGDRFSVTKGYERKAKTKAKNINQRELFLSETA